jgi:hypothetical protein
MYCLVLLSALLACAAGKCYSCSNVILDGPDIQDLYMCLWTELSRAEPRESLFSYIVNKFTPHSLEQNVHYHVNKSNPIVSILTHTNHLIFSHSKLNIPLNIIRQPKSSSSKWTPFFIFLQQNHIDMRRDKIISP